MIGTTRRLNPHTQTLEFSRLSTSKIQNPTLDPAQRESVIYRIHPELERGKLIYQIGTANPDLAVEAARLVAPYVAGIDVNAGCPKPFSTEGGMGAALLKTPDLLCSILTRLVEDVGKPFEIGISVKIRILDKPEDTEALVRKLVATGITGLTVHCRTTPMRPRERAIRDQLRMIGQVCREAGVACLMNGDVTSRSHALQLVQEYGVDGAMIATEAEKNSYCFHPDAEGGHVEWKKRWRETVTEYMKLAIGVQNRWGNTKYLLGQMIPGKEKAFNDMTRSKCYRDCVKALGLENVGDLMQQAEVVDARLGIPIQETRASKRARIKECKKEEAEGNDTKRVKVQNVEADDLPLATELAHPPTGPTPVAEAAVMTV
jgi:tRNA-dihydrouridine synthase 2